MVNAGSGIAWLEYARRKTEEQPPDQEDQGGQNAITSRVRPGNRPVRSERPVQFL
jgi:hypothetical protein